MFFWNFFSIFTPQVYIIHENTISFFLSEITFYYLNFIIFMYLQD